VREGATQPSAGGPRIARIILASAAAAAARRLAHQLYSASALGRTSSGAAATAAAAAGPTRKTTHSRLVSLGCRYCAPFVLALAPSPPPSRSLWLSHSPQLRAFLPLSLSLSRVRRLPRSLSELHSRRRRRALPFVLYAGSAHLSLPLAPLRGWTCAPAHSGNPGLADGAPVFGIPKGMTYGTWGRRQTPTSLRPRPHS
jgi:hypothetical protein